jgi:hypothetical protein
MTPTGGSGNQGVLFAAPIIVVPEPSTLAFAVVGGVGLLVARRCRRMFPVAS